MTAIYKVPYLFTGTLDMKGKTPIIKQQRVFDNLKSILEQMIEEFQINTSEVRGYKVLAFYKLLRKFFVEFRNAEDADLYIGYMGGADVFAYIDAVIDLIENGDKEVIKYLLNDDYISFPIYYRLKYKVLPYFFAKGKTRTRKDELTFGLEMRSFVGSAHYRMSEASQGATLGGERFLPIE